ncbi:BQ5605_C034g11293 [Microbotryum silenes-dioicae]|uniref:BQ5605_C034g11293 protein n=1 Tax=Microbotryum silenes-dioicae TaxID=796604 RepID=A0A2X0N2P6_9BASI|nr:BQ5605_C034g11293 [Microbotryum silenes-dioicae]
MIFPGSFRISLPTDSAVGRGRRAEIAKSSEYSCRGNPKST